MFTQSTTRSQWEFRQQAYGQITSDLEVHYRRLGRPLTVLAQALTDLNGFADGMFAFFHSNFPPQGKALAPSVQRPPDHIYARLVARVGDDLEVIQRAAEQRLSAPSSLADALLVADYLVARLVKQAVAGGFLEEGTQAITYFQKSATIRVIPYAKLALIGVPYTVLTEPRDLLAIPHEVGHYVFWHGRAEPGSNRLMAQALFSEGQAALKSLKPLTAPFDAWCYVWLEEMFADVFACWMAGPGPALTMQDQASSYSQELFITSDDDHPVPLIRPYLHLKALAQRNVPGWKDCAKLLKSQWDASTRRNFTAFRLKDYQHTPIEIDVALTAGYTLDADKPVDGLITVILNRLKKFTALPLDDWRIMSSVPASVEELGDQYEAFQAGLLAQARATPRLTTAVLPAGETFAQWATTHLSWPPADSPDKADQEKLRLKKMLLTRVPAETPITEEAWLPILLANGWTTEPGQIPWPNG